jgi:transcriptional regulator with GAF, ATPase, and Fis domain
MELMVGANDDELCAALDRLAGRVSSSLLAVAPDDVAPAIEQALRLLGEALEADRALFIQPATAEDSESVLGWVRGSEPSIDLDVDLKGLIALAHTLADRSEPTVLERIPEDIPAEALAAASDLEPLAPCSAVIVPVLLPGFTCALVVGTAGRYQVWPARAVAALRLLAEILAAAWHRRTQELALREGRAEVARLSASLRVDPRATAPPPSAGQIPEMVGDSPALRGAVARLLDVAASDCTVLLLGETGTGKELFARVLHGRSPRRSFPLVSVNSAALPPTLIESELFGHERGAFTGAVAPRQGRFELAHRGTLFLDEIGDLPLDLQAKLLRVLQEGEFERLGTSRSRRVDVRIVAATHRDLKEAVAEGGFRDDLYYRLNVFPIRVPPLRERLEDIPALVWHFIHKRQRAMHRTITRVPAEVIELLQQQSWPGNIRELENVIERALIHSTGDTLVMLEDDLEAAARDSSEDGTTLSAIERAHIEEVLRVCGWRINGAGNAAERLGLHPNTLRFRMKKLGIVRRRPPPPSPARPH